MLAVILAVASSLGYGVADFAGGLATRSAPVLRIVGITTPVSLAVVAAAVPVLGARWSAGALGWGAAAGLASAAAFALLYQSLALGPMGVLSPVTAVVSAVIPATVGIAEGERLDGVGVTGIVLAIIAVVAVSAGAGEGTGEAAGAGAGKAAGAGEAPGTGQAAAGPGRRPTMTALGLAVAAGAAIAAQLVCLSRSPHDSGAAPLIACRVLSAAILLLAAGLRRQGAPAGRPDRWLAVAAGIFDAAANVAFLVAVRSGSLVVVAVITALYPGATVLLARRVLRERLSPVQVAGLLTAAAAVTILAVS
jgi:drug/metabolite transporter (DMT)-like permease